MNKKEKYRNPLIFKDVSVEDLMENDDYEIIPDIESMEINWYYVLDYCNDLLYGGRLKDNILTVNVLQKDDDEKGSGSRTIVNEDDIILEYLAHDAFEEFCSIYGY